METRLDVYSGGRFAVCRLLTQCQGQEFLSWVFPVSDLSGAWNLPQLGRGDLIKTFK